MIDDNRIWYEPSELERLRARVVELEAELIAVQNARSYEHSQTVALMGVIGFRDADIDMMRSKLGQVEAERDAARQSAAAWKRSAKMWREVALNEFNVSVKDKAAQAKIYKRGKKDFG